MKTIRRLAWTAVTVAYLQVVLGAVVRITGSGMGCGDHWPLCNGRVIPALDHPEVWIEWMHRLTALLVGLAVAALALAAFTRRKERGIGGPFMPAMVSAGLYVVLALLGAVTVWLELPYLSIVLHLSAALALLATLTLAALRAGSPAGPPGNAVPDTDRKLRAGATVGLSLAALTLILGGLTANLGAGPACQGFPLCNNSLIPQSGPGGLVHIHWTHRVLAYLLFFHVAGMWFRGRKRDYSPPARRALTLAAGLITAQVTVAAIMVLTFLPPGWRALHVATGTALWIAMFDLAWRSTPGARTAGSGPPGSPKA